MFFSSITGCASGLKAFNIGNEKLTHIANIGFVINMAIVPNFPKSILISENGRKIIQCDLKHLQTRANASVCLNTGMDYTELSLSFIKENNRDNDLWRFAKIFDNTERDKNISEPTAIAATYTQIVILRYDCENQYFQAQRALDTASPIQSIYFTPFTAIVSSDKFFEIDLNTLISEEFLDMSDASLVHTLASCPANTFAVNTQEYLLCFKEYGVFVNEFGCRTRPTELKWLKDSPREFAYRAPILYIFAEDGIELMRIHKSQTDSELAVDESDCYHGGKSMTQTFLVASNAVFGANFDKYGIYALTSNDGGSNASTKQIIRIDGTKALNYEHFGSMETIE